MHTLRINYIIISIPEVCAFHRLGMCAKDFILNKMAGKDECACSSCFETTEYTCLRCERLKKKKNLFLKCTRTSNQQKLSNTGYIKGEASRLLRTKSSKTTLCGSRKYPYPHHGGNWKFQRGGGVNGPGNSRGEEG